MRSLRNPDFESVETDQYTVGGTGPLSGIFGDENEWIPLFPIRNYQFNNSWTTTSYGEIHSGARRFGVDTDTIPTLTGIDAHGVALKISKLQNDTAGETATVRLKDSNNNSIYTDTEITATNPEIKSAFSTVQELQDQGRLAFGVEGKVSAGTGFVSYHSAVICGRIA